MAIFGTETNQTGNTLDVLARFGPKKLAGHAAVGMAAWQLVQPWVQKARYRHVQRRLFTITVNGTDEVYPELHDWVLGLIPTDERRALVAFTQDARRNEYVEPGSGKGPAPRVRLRYDGSRTQIIELEGHRVEVEVSREEMGRDREKLPDNWRLLFEHIVFRTRSASGRDAVVRHIDAILETKHKKPGPPPFFMSSRWGSGWDERDDLPRRTLDSIILRDGQLERLILDLGAFLDSELDYTQRCIPWHRGYLFHGLPGTGKTSVVKALANYFDLRLYYLPLGDLEGDKELVNMVSRVQPRSILLLEDIDVFHAATHRDDNSKVTLSALLNALDGVWTPHGLITVMTTNNRDALDEALNRPGRVDVDEHFDLLDAEQTTRMVEWFYPGMWSPRDRGAAEMANEVSPAELMVAMIRHPERPEAALNEVANNKHDPLFTGMSLSG